MPLIIAHRGDSKHAPENTFAAFRRAVIAGADGIELDVRLAKDGVAVVFHDASLKRVAGREGKVADYTSSELGSMDVGSWFNLHVPKLADPAYNSERVRTLAETLEFLGNFEGLIYIELKSKETDTEQLARAVTDVICTSKLLPQVVVKSFKLAAIPSVKKLCPNVRTAALFAPKIKNILRQDKHLLRLAQEAGADEISLHYTLATRNLMKNAAKRNLRVIIWTADNPRWIRRAIKLGVAAIITNDPARLLDRRREVLG
ncbi:MAG: glycerophosphodiester phosphodiesterase family protein [bacterium]|nr:glycerophosphodiester phosphodiesterase family protein [bacterium]